MEKIYHYYRSVIENNEKRVERLKKYIHLAGTLRLLLVAGLIGCIWIAREQSLLIWTLIFIGFIIPFASLMIWHTKLFARKTYAETLITLCKNELKGLDLDFSGFDGAREAVNGTHDFSLDLDLFGSDSLFQSINRTVTLSGKNRLIAWFTKPLTDKAAIQSRQESVCELGKLIEFRQEFLVTGQLQQAEQESLQNESLFGSTDPATPYITHKAAWRVLTVIMPILWIVIFGGCLAGWFTWTLPGAFFIVSMFLSMMNAKKIARLYQRANRLEPVLKTFSHLITCIEKTTFQGAQLSRLRQEFFLKEVSASTAVFKLSRHIQALDSRFNLIGILLNIFLLRDTRNAIELEAWKDRYATIIPFWFDALAEFDALISLGGFAYNHPDAIYPEIAGQYFKMEGKALAHPLMRRDKCVKNDISIPDSARFLIITGANMAGKSTYLRTVGINFWLACIGAPVCAESLTVYPAHLVTSLRTTDSLTGNESYFFAELKRLKMIIDRLQAGEQLFIILDEILKGTNSVDKQKGSIALMKQLVGYKTCGIIATHDLVLGELACEFPENIRNYRFEASIEKDELTFSYQLQDGVAQNMNACFLMQKMGITV